MQRTERPPNHLLQNANIAAAAYRFAVFGVRAYFTGTAHARLERPTIKPPNYAMDFPMEQGGLCKS